MNPRYPTPLLFASLLALACGPETEEGPVFCAVPLDGSPRRGPEDAPVAVVEFADFECPYCRSVEPTLRTLLDEREGEVALVFKHAPSGYHPHALAAALATACADEQGLFWELHDELIAPGAALDDAALVSHAESVGVDLPLWRECLSSDAAYLRIERDLQAATDAGVPATPTFFINGRALVGAVSLEDFEALVDDAAAAAAASGESPTDHYASLQERRCR